MCAERSILWVVGSLCSIVVLGVSLFINSPLSAQTVAQQAQTPSSPAARSIEFHEELIAQVPAGSQIEDFATAGSRVAWEEKKGKTCIVQLDGKQQGGTFERIERLHFNTDGTHLAFFGKRDGKWIFVLDGQERAGGYTFQTEIVYQPHGSSFAYSACVEKKKCQLVVDGKETGPEYEDISYPQYSADGKRLAYFAKRNGKWVAVVDGKETGPELVSVDFADWGFSSRANRFYAAVMPTHSGWTYLVDDAVGTPFQAISLISFSADDAHFAYAGAESRGGLKKQAVTSTIVLDGQPGQSYEGSGLPGAWTMALGVTENMVWGPHRLDPNFHGLSDPQFNSEGKLAYAVRREKGDIVLMNGGQTGPSFDDLASTVVFTEDRKHFAYIARHGSDFVEVRDNQPGKTFSMDSKSETIGQVSLSPDGTHFAFETVRGGRDYFARQTTRARRTIILDGQPGTEYNALGALIVRFSKDGRISFYQVFGADGNRVLTVIDGQESKHYDGQTFAGFAPDDKSLTFLAQDSLRLLRITAALP